MSDDDQVHYQRALLASRFMESDAAELASMLAHGNDPGWAKRAVLGLRLSRKHFALMAAQCELAACAIDEAIG